MSKVIDSAMTDLTDDSDWQVIKGKRNMCFSPTDMQHKKVKLNQNDIPNVSNRFDLLSNNDEEAVVDQPKIPKPPPIYIPGVDNIHKFINHLRSKIDFNNFTYKIAKNNEIRLMLDNVENYKSAVKFLTDNGKAFHTYQLKEKRAFRCVMKGLHHTTSVDSIKAELTLLGHAVRSVFNAKGRFTKQPLAMFFIDIEPDDNNKDIYKINRLLNAVVKVEPLRKTPDLVQCFRCQEFGHTQNYCRKTFRCVKCALNHRSSECPKLKESAPQCVHCLQQHTANYKGCQVYQELIKNRSNIHHSQVRVPQTQSFNLNSAQGANRETTTTSFSSYADVTKGFNNNNNSSQNNNYNSNNNNNSSKYEINLMEKIDLLINKQTEFINNVMNMMTTMINKLCTRI